MSLSLHTRRRIERAAQHVPVATAPLLLPILSALTPLWHAIIERYDVGGTQQTYVAGIPIFTLKRRRALRVWLYETYGATSVIGFLGNVLGGALLIAAMIVTASLLITAHNLYRD